jgi:hypothetical protein
MSIASPLTLDLISIEPSSPLVISAMSLPASWISVAMTGGISGGVSLAIGPGRDDAAGLRVDQRMGERVRVALDVHVGPVRLQPLTCSGAKIGTSRGLRLVVSMSLLTSAL